MTIMQIIFLVVGAVILGSAFMVVTTGNLIHAALWLIVTLFGVAVLYALLNAGFLAVVQVVIYIGAIAILFIFAVMLTRKEMRDRGPQLNNAWWLSGHHCSSHLWWVDPHPAKLERLYQAPSRYSHRV